MHLLQRRGEEERYSIECRVQKKQREKVYVCVCMIRKMCADAGECCREEDKKHLPGGLAEEDVNAC